MSIAYEVPTSVSASSIVPHAIGVQFKHNDSLLGGSGEGYSCNYDGTYRISSKYVDDYIDGQAATVLVNRDYALIYVTVKNNTSSSMNYISQFSLVTTGGTSYPSCFLQQGCRLLILQDNLSWKLGNLRTLLPDAY